MTGTAVRLGAWHFRVHEPARLVEQASWPELRALPGTRAWQVRFVSPACVRRRNRAAPLLNPDALGARAGGAVALLDPATAPRCRAARGRTGVGQRPGRAHRGAAPVAHGATGRQARDGSEEVISGFIGRVRYVCDQGTDAEAAAFGCAAGVRRVRRGRIAHRLRVRRGRSPSPPGSRRRSGPASREHGDRPRPPALPRWRRSPTSASSRRPGLTCWPATSMTASSAPGVARFAEDAEQNLAQMAAELAAGTYRPGQLAPVSLPRPDGQIRVLHVPAVRDRVVRAVHPGCAHAGHRPAGSGRSATPTGRAWAWRTPSRRSPAARRGTGLGSTDRLPRLLRPDPGLPAAAHAAAC